MDTICQSMTAEKALHCFRTVQMTIMMAILLVNTALPDTLTTGWQVGDYLSNHHQSEELIGGWGIIRGGGSGGGGWTSVVRRADSVSTSCTAHALVRTVTCPSPDRWWALNRNRLQSLVCPARQRPCVPVCSLCDVQPPRYVRTSKVADATETADGCPAEDCPPGIQNRWSKVPIAVQMTHRPSSRTETRAKVCDAAAGHCGVFGGDRGRSGREWAWAGGGGGGVRQTLGKGPSGLAGASTKGASPPPLRNGHRLPRRCQGFGDFKRPARGTAPHRPVPGRPIRVRPAKEGRRSGASGHRRCCCRLPMPQRRPTSVPSTDAGRRDVCAGAALTAGCSTSKTDTSTCSTPPCPAPRPPCEKTGTRKTGCPSVDRPRCRAERADTPLSLRVCWTAQRVSAQRPKKG